MDDQTTIEAIALDSLGKTPDQLDPLERHVIQEIWDGLLTYYRRVVSISCVQGEDSMSVEKTPDNERLSGALEVLQNDFREIIRNAVAKARENIELRKGLMRRMGMPESDVDDIEFTVAQMQLEGRSHSEAARWALKRLGRFSKMTEIIDTLQRFGYEAEVSKKNLGATLTVSMNRREGWFTKDGTLWGLVEWEKD